MSARKKPPRAKVRVEGAKRRPAQRARAGGEPKSDDAVAALVARATELLMGRGVKACLREKLPSTIIIMAASEQVGLLASMMNLPYPQALQTACNGVEAVYRAAAPEQVISERPIEQMAKAMLQKVSQPEEIAPERCELGKEAGGGLTPP